MKLTDMKNENDKPIGGVIATAIGCIILGVIYSLVEHSLFSIILFSLAAVGIVAVFILYQKVSRSTEALETVVFRFLQVTREYVVKRSVVLKLLGNGYPEKLIR